jgi:D-alanyl-D-alanine carboxypeptidase
VHWPALSCWQVLQALKVLQAQRQCWAVLPLQARQRQPVKALTMQAHRRQQECLPFPRADLLAPGPVRHWQDLLKVVPSGQALVQSPSNSASPLP